MNCNNEGDMDKFSVVMRGLYLHFSERKTGDVSALCRAYAEALAAYSVDEIAAAGRTWVRIGKRFPFVADLIEILDGKTVG